MIGWILKRRLFNLNSWKVLIAFTVLMSIVPLSAASAEESGEKPDQEETSRNRMELFLGNTHDEGEDAFSVGVTYEYRFRKLIGLGALWEYADGDFDKWIAGVPFFLHPYKGLRFEVAPGVEHAESDNEFLVRLGVGYEFEIGRWSITPEFNMDFVDGEESIVYGISFGYGF